MWQPLAWHSTAHITSPGTARHGTAQHGRPQLGTASSSEPAPAPALHIPSQDIYIARAEGELQLEEELFYLLLKIYKTPSLLNELTRLSQQQQQQAGQAG